MTHHRGALAGLALSAAVLVAACGGGAGATGGSTATPVTTVASVAKVSANTATRAELTTALEAAGVTNPGRWAGEILEYRPYPTDDPTLAKLRQELTKYNPGSEVLEEILATLEP